MCINLNLSLSFRKQLRSFPFAYLLDLLGGGGFMRATGDYHIYFTQAIKTICCTCFYVSILIWRLDPLI